MFSSKVTWRKDPKALRGLLTFLPFLIFTLLSHNRLQSALLFRVHEMFSMLVRTMWIGKMRPVKAALELDETFKLTNAVDSEQVLSADLSGIE